MLDYLSQIVFPLGSTKQLHYDTVKRGVLGWVHDRQLAGKSCDFVIRGSRGCPNLYFARMFSTRFFVEITSTEATFEFHVYNLYSGGHCHIMFVRDKVSEKVRNRSL